MRDVKSILSREFQLNLLSYVIIIVLTMAIGLLVTMLALDLRATDLWLLRNEFAQILIPGLLVAVVLYMADTHRRLRLQLKTAHDELVQAQERLKRAHDRISFAHHVSTEVVFRPAETAIRYALKESARHFNADAVAVVADDVEVFADNEAEAEAAYSVALKTAVDGVGAGTTDLFTLSHDGYEVMAAPLRIEGHLRAVACLMRHGEPFSEEDAKGLELLGRVLELGIQNKMLLTGMQDQLRGMLTTLSTLVEDRHSDYRAHSTRIANMSVAVGRALGMTDEQLEELKLAALLHDVGMLFVPPEVVDASRQLTAEEQAMLQQHPTKGAELAKNASFNESVQKAIMAHHERLNGSGYPQGLGGLEIPLSARIIAVCDSFDAMTHSRSYRPSMHTMDAIAELKRGVGGSYDPKVVSALVRVLDQQAAAGDVGRSVPA